MADTKNTLEKKHKDLLERIGTLYATSDGQAFYTEKYASRHATNKGLKVYELKATRKAAKKEDKKQ